MKLKAIISWVVLSALAVHAKHVLPEESLVSTRQTEAFLRDISGGEWSKAVQRVQNWIENPETRLIAVDNHRWVSVQRWVDSVLGTNRQAFVLEYEKVFGVRVTEGAKQAVQEGSVRKMMMLSGLYPWSPSAGRLNGQVAELLMDRGDIRSALAVQKRSVTGSENPTVSDWESLGTDSIAPMVAFAPPWYTTGSTATPKYIPVGIKDLCVIAGPRGLLALNPAGKVLWDVSFQGELKVTSLSKGKAVQIPFPPDRSILRPIIWLDRSGTARLVITRHTNSEGMYLQAYHPLTGELIWTTRSDEQTRDLVMIGNPIAVGGYVYFVAARFDSVKGLQMVVGSLDLVTGKPEWLTPVGQEVDEVTTQQRKNDVQLPGSVRAMLGVGDMPVELSFDDHQVYVVLRPCVIAIDRFTGNPNWFVTYPVRSAEKKQLNKSSPSRRWRDVAWSDQKNVVVVAPIDSDEVFGLDSLTGEKRWVMNQRGTEELIGVSDQHAILIGTSLTAVDTTTGQVLWQNAPPRGQIIGPGYIDEKYVGVPTDQGVVHFQIDNGIAVSFRSGKTLSLNPLLKQPEVRQWLQTLQMTGVFE